AGRPGEGGAGRGGAHAGRRGLGASEQRSARSARAADGPPGEGEAERESARAGRRGLGASEQRSARSARAADGPPGEGEAERESAHVGRRGLGASEARRARSARAPHGPPGDKVTKILLVCRRELASMCGGPLAWVLAAVHPFAVAPVVAGYAGLVLLGVAFVACGAAASTVSENQVVSAMLAYGVLVFAWFATWNEAAIGERIAPALLQLSLFDHFYG